MFKVKKIELTYSYDDEHQEFPIDTNIDELNLSFRDLVSLFEYHDFESSMYPIKSGDYFWLQAIEANMFSGDITRTSFHLIDPTKSQLRYWYKAFNWSKQ